MFKLCAHPYKYVHRKELVWLTRNHANTQGLFDKTDDRIVSIRDYKCY